MRTIQTRAKGQHSRFFNSNGTVGVKISAADLKDPYKRSYDDAINHQTRKFLLTGVLLGTARSECDNNWIPFYGSCYFFGEVGEEYVVAEQFCLQHGAHLVHINDAKENEFVKNWLRRFKHSNWWMGLTDTLVEGEWMWEDSMEAVNFTDWHPGQPNDYGHHEDCAHFSDQSGDDFQWRDYQCDGKYNPVCEKRKLMDGIEIVG